MSKLSKKLIVRITIVLCIVFILSLALNTLFLPKYYLYTKKNKLADVTSQMMDMTYAQIMTNSEQIETENQVTIVSVPLSDSINNLNDELKEKLNRKGVTLSKFWLTEESVERLRQGNRVHKIYDQAKLKSSYLVNFLPIQGDLFAVGESIAHSSDTLQIVNRFNAYVWIGALLLLILLSAMYATRIVRPLTKLNDAAESISKLSFSNVNIRTGDEIEYLAESINRMSDRLEEAQQSLEDKNANLRTFIADISHELKTPLALIQVYASGMKDGLDDGTFADVIRQQSEEMAKMIDRLLKLSRLQVEPYRFEPVAFRALVADMLNAYRIAFEQQGLTLEMDDRLHEEVWVSADQIKLESVLQNFLTNALKYTTGKHVQVTMEAVENKVIFRIVNEADTVDAAKWASVWEPFYVMESSRNKKLSGTGLGLSIAKTILENHHASFGHVAEEGIVEFYCSFPILTGESV